jgi:peptidoglycan hydrolase-like protein with peptidoglycan-binding domain
VALVTAGQAAAASGAAATPAFSPFTGTALWVAEVPAQSTPQQLAGQAAQGGVHTLFVKAADGSTADPQFTAALVSGLRAAGETVCGWTFAYGENPLGEAAAAVAAVHAGAQCLIVDAEGAYDTRYGAAQLFVRTLRSQLGSAFPMGLAGQAEVLQHPKFPYSVFLGPGGFNFDLPQIYWLDLGVSVDAAYSATIDINSVYGRPIVPVGQLYESPLAARSPSATEVTRFRALAGAYGSPGLSFFDLDRVQSEVLASFGTPATRLARKRVLGPTLPAGADGDEVVWAQELLNGAGARLPVGGFLGAQTTRAIAHFQARHHLRASGLLGPATWKALSRLHAREPSWAKAPPDSAR